MLSACGGISDLVRLLKADDTGSAENTALLPFLDLLQVCGLPIPDTDGFHTLFARRPTLRIEHTETFAPRHIDAHHLKETIEKLGRNDEPGVFKSRDFELLLS